MDEAITDQVNEVTDPNEMPAGRPPAGPDLTSPPPAPDLQEEGLATAEAAVPGSSPGGPDLAPPPEPELGEAPDSGEAAPEEAKEVASTANPPAEAYTAAVSRPQPAEFAAFTTNQPKEDGKLGMLMDVTLHVTVELGRTRIPVREVLDLQSGSVIELDREAGEVVDVFVNEHLIAKGEVVVVDDKYGIRITEFIKNDRILGGS